MVFSPHFAFLPFFVAELIRLVLRSLFYSPPCHNITGYGEWIEEKSLCLYIAY